MIRKLIDHTTTLFNSLMILVLEAGVNPDDLYDGDRIQIRIALKKVCDAFGIDVVFPEPEAARNQPVTQQDLLTQRFTLGGLVQWARIEGRVFKDPGDLTGLGLAIVPMSILVP